MGLASVERALARGEIHVRGEAALKERRLRAHEDAQTARIEPGRFGGRARWLQSRLDAAHQGAGCFSAKEG